MVKRRNMDNAGMKCVLLPLRSPKMNAYAECWVRFVKEAGCSHLILCGEAAPRYSLQQHEVHYHPERLHQGRGHIILMPIPSPGKRSDGFIHCRERLRGLLKY